MNRFPTLLVIGGRYAVAWPTLLFYGISLGLFNISVDISRLEGNIAPLLWLTMIGTLAGLTPLVLAQKTFLPVTSRPERPAMTILIWLLSGSLRSLAVIWAGEPFELVPNGKILDRMGAAILVTALTLIIGEAIISRFYSIAARSRELGNQLAVLRTQLEQTSYFAERDRAELIARTQEIFRLELRDLEIRLAAQDAVTVTEIQHFTDDFVRPLSHEIASLTIPVESPLPIQEPPSWSEQFQQRISASSLIQPLWTVVIVAIFRAAGLLVAGSSFVLFLPTLVVTALILTLVKMAVRRVQVTMWFAVISSIAAAAIAGLIAALTDGFLLGSQAPSRPWSYSIGVMIAAMMLTALSAADQIFHDYVAESEKLKGTLEMQSHRARQEMWLARKHIAAKIHGPIQGALQASTMKLMHLATGEYRDVSPVLDYVRQSLSELQAPISTSIEEVRESLLGLQVLWSAQCSIQNTIQPGSFAILKNDPASCQAVIEVVTEGVLNAVKHANATTIYIDILESKSDIVITIWNDGRSITESAQPGYGSRSFDELCAFWSLATVDGGTLLSATIVGSSRS
ncbi:signal transduction histidine kinase [Aurantimicrobium minutum]|nr:signal transduction histidine kinase [Aurantimicrobium minutum]